MCSAALQLHPWFPCKAQFRLQNERPCCGGYVYMGKNLKASFFTRPSHGMISLNQKNHSPKLLQQYDSSDPNRNLSGKCSIGGGAAADIEDVPQEDEELQSQQGLGFWSKWKANSAEMSAKLAKLGLAAVLGYGLFDGVTYTSFFVLAFLGYEKSTGKNPAANLQALLGIVILMWTGNNVTRPFRVAGAAALAPVIDKGLKKIQKYFNFPNTIYAFALVAAMIACVCGTVVGLLIVSKWGR